MLVQHSRYRTQGWRANGDISVIISKIDPANPSVNEIISTERYITGYACRGNQPTRAVIDLFNDEINGYILKSWPLDDCYCRSTLLLHWPNWRTIQDIKSEEITWTEQMTDFLQSDASPNFVKAEIERAKCHPNSGEQDENENLAETEELEEPEWMESIRPHAHFTATDSDINYDDGGPNYDCSETFSYPPSNSTFIESICEKYK